MLSANTLLAKAFSPIAILPTLELLPFKANPLIVPVTPNDHVI
jgi:hypothetical protein